MTIDKQICRYICKKQNQTPSGKHLHKEHWRLANQNKIKNWIQSKRKDQRNNPHT